MKRKKTKKILATVLASTTALTALVGCKPRVDPWDSSDLAKDVMLVNIYDGGYGTDWAKVAAETFNAAHPENEYKIQIKPEKLDIGTVVSYSENGLNINRGEVAYFVGSNSDAIKNGVKKGVLSDLSDMLTKSPDGNDMTLQEKIRNYDVWKKAMSAEDGTGLYSLPYSDSIIGFVFNYDKFLEAGYLDTVSPSDTAAIAEIEAQGITYEVQNGQLIFKSYSGDYEYLLYEEGDVITACGRDGVYGSYDDGQPNTITEWDAMVQMIAADMKPFIFTGTYSYSYSISAFYSIIADVAGSDALETLYSSDSKGKEIELKDGTKTVITKENGYEAYKIKGIEEALDFLYTYMNVDTSRDNNYLHPVAYLESGYSHKQSQSSYLYAQATGGTSTNPEAAMLYDGTWWENEARPAFDSLVSAGYAEYGIGKQDFRYMLYPHYDESATTSKFSSYGSEVVVVPSVVDRDPAINAKKLAIVKDFLLYTMSDEVLQNFTVETSCVRPFHYDIPAEKYSQMSGFAKSFWALYADMENVEIVRPQIFESLVPAHTTDYKMFPVQLDSYSGYDATQWLNFINQYQSVYPNKQWIGKVTTNMYEQAQANWNKYFVE